MINGYIVKNKDGDSLSKNLFWFPHKKNEDAWVHPKSILAVLDNLDAYRVWDVKPYEAYIASYEKVKGVTVTGVKIRLDKERIHDRRRV